MCTHSFLPHDIQQETWITKRHPWYDAVAMTRPRRHLCVIGDSSTIVHGGAYLKKWMEWLEKNADVRFAELD